MNRSTQSANCSEPSFVSIEARLRVFSGLLTGISFARMFEPGSYRAIRASAPLIALAIESGTQGQTEPYRSLSSGKTLSIESCRQRQCWPVPLGEPRNRNPN